MADVGSYPLVAFLPGMRVLVWRTADLPPRTLDVAAFARAMVLDEQFGAAVDARVHEDSGHAAAVFAWARAASAPPAGSNVLGNIGGGVVGFTKLDNDQISDDAITGGKIREDTITVRELAEAVVALLLPDPSGETDDRRLAVLNRRWAVVDAPDARRTDAEIEGLIAGRVKPGMLNGGAVVAGELVAGATARKALMAAGGDNAAVSWDSVVGYGLALPEEIAAGAVFFRGADLFLGSVLAAGAAQAFRLDPGTDPTPGDDDVGFSQAAGADAFGSVDEAGVEDWLWRLYWEDSTQQLRCEIQSATDPGDVAANIVGAGQFALTGSREVSTNLWQTNAAAQAATFGQARDVSLTPTNAITYWRQVEVAGVQGPKGDKGDPGDDAAVTAAAVYPLTKAIVRAGSNITVTADDGNRTLTVAGQAGGGGGDPVGQITRLTALPSAGDHDVGDIVNFNGDLYELVADAEDSNILRGTVAARTSPFIGDANFEWEPTSTGNSPYPVHLFVSKEAIQAAPANIYIKVSLANGFVTDIVMERRSGSDTATRWAYQKASGEPDIEEAATGSTYTVQVFSNTGFTTALAIHSGDRWERDDREQIVAGESGADVRLDATRFTGNLSSTDTDAQTAFETLDALAVGGGAAADLYESVDALPADAAFGDHYRLLMADTVAEYGIIRAGESTDASGWFTGIGTANPSQDDVDGIFWAKATYGSGGATILRNNLVFVRDAAETRTPTHFYLKGADDSEVEYTARAAGAGLAHFFIANHNGVRVAANPFVNGDAYGFRVRWSSGADTFPSVRKAPGLYIYDGFNFDRVTGADETDRQHFAGAFEKLEDAVHGLHVPGANAARRTTLQALDTPYRIGADDAGVLFVSVQWTVTNTATLALGDETRSTTQVFISELRETTADDGNATAPHEGILAGTVDVENTAGVKQGEASLYLSRNAANDVGLWVLYSPEAAGAAGNNGSIQARVEISRFLSDVPTIKPTITREAVAADVEIFTTRTGASDGTQLVGYTDSAATDASSISAWVNLYTHTATTPETNTHEDDLTCRTGWIPRNGGDRAKIEYRGVLLPAGRTVVTANDVLWVHDAYLRNLNNDYRTKANSFASEQLSQQISKTVSIPAGGRYLVQARIAIQVAAAAGSVGSRGSNAISDFKIIWPASLQRHAVVAY